MKNICTNSSSMWACLRFSTVLPELLQNTKWTNKQFFFWLVIIIIIIAVVIITITITLRLYPSFTSVFQPQKKRIKIMSIQYVTGEVYCREVDPQCSKTILLLIYGDKQWCRWEMYEGKGSRQHWSHWWQCVKLVFLSCWHSLSLLNTPFLPIMASLATNCLIWQQIERDEDKEYLWGDAVLSLMKEQWEA